jgi:hypothetical protein
MAASDAWPRFVMDYHRGTEGTEGTEYKNNWLFSSVNLCALCASVVNRIPANP